MAPQTSIPTAANVLGVIGTILWCIQLIPQIIHNYRLKKTEGLPGSMMCLWATAAVPLGAYAVIQNFNVPLQIQPQAFGTLSLITWAQILIYHHKWSVKRATASMAGLYIILAGVEAALIVSIRGPYKRGLSWPVQLVGITGGVILNIGILPPYPEIWKRRGRVVGINWIFLSMDTMGAVFSLLALVVQNSFDVLGGSVYIVVLVLEGGIYISHIIWLLRTRDLRKRAKLEGKDFDDLPEARKYQYHPQEKGQKSPAPASTDLEKGNSTTSIVSASTRESELSSSVTDPAHNESGSFGRRSTVTVSNMDFKPPEQVLASRANAPTDTGDIYHVEEQGT